MTELRQMLKLLSKLKANKDNIPKEDLLGKYKNAYLRLIGEINKQSVKVFDEILDARYKFYKGDEGDRDRFISDLKSEKSQFLLKDIQKSMTDGDFRSYRMGINRYIEFLDTIYAPYRERHILYALLSENEVLRYDEVNDLVEIKGRWYTSDWVKKKFMLVSMEVIA